MPILPDSTGRRLFLSHHYELNYDAATGAFSVDDEITAVSSNIVAVVKKVIELTGTTGTLILTLSKADQDGDTVFTDGENLQVNAITIATANGVGFSVYNQNVAIAGGNNPDFRANVDEAGAVSVRYPEAPLVFSSYGGAKVSNSTLLKSYEFMQGGLTDQFTTISGSGASETFVSASRAVLLSNPTTSGANIQKISDMGHRVLAGSSNMAVLGILVGDTGKANVIRRWGLYDSEDGLFFQMSGSSLSVVHRSSTTGTKVDTVISQSSWNGDRLDGSQSEFNNSGIAIDVSKTHLFWVDYKHLGAGSARFGTWDGSSRVIMHEIVFGNTSTDSWMAKHTLPICVEQENEDTSISTSELRFYGASVTSNDEFIEQKLAKSFNFGVEDKLVTNTPTALFTIKPSLTHNGLRNLHVSLLKNLLYSSVDNSDGITDERVRIIIYSSSSLSGSSFDATPSPSRIHLSSMLADVSGTLSSSFLSVESDFRLCTVPTKGTSNLDISELTTYQNRPIIVKADDTVEPITFAAQTTRAGVTASVDLVTSWIEIPD